ncbi:NADH dehydrogenase [Frankia sp. R43]|uniref:hydrogen gas-evolving membrane-bound hydrogenase subunit E n=1 Tax=Frankia sp. R43 TaxID=269536 RepID=UPI0006C9FD60|nr:NADH dehydrogenase [Frankia sp. R43]
MFVALGAHLLLAVTLPALAGRLGRGCYLLAATVPAAAFGWLVARIPAVLDSVPTGGAGAGAGAAGSAGLTEVIPWAGAVGLELALRLTPLALLMALLVTGVGALVMIYSFSYHDADGAHGTNGTKETSGAHGAPAGPPARPRGLGGMSAALLGFAGAMLGLVLADDLFTLYVFWELTTVLSFLLIGQDGIGAANRRSALQALLTTTLGGLPMLLGFVLLGMTAGTTRISAIVAAPPSGPVVTVALVLVLVGAVTKSAQLPFHSWLPAAMVAPTPVSAYLHAAAMVKAGVFLIAALMPAFADVPGWRVPAVVIGATTMLLGGARALRQTDLKLLLAFGTVSQLGFLTALVGFGSRTAALAGATVLLAHGLFKSALFMVVGVIDHQAGTRDIRELCGLGRAVPGVCAVAVFAAASMVGLPPFLGFLGKEAAFEAFAHGGPGDQVLLGVLVAGAVLTTAYTLRFLWGAFASPSGRQPRAMARPTVLFVLPAAMPALAGLGLGLNYQAVDRLVGSYADGYPSSGDRYHLALWHGLGLPVWLTVVAIGGGALLFAAGLPGASPAGRSGRSARSPLVPSGAWVARVRRVRRVLDGQRGYEQAVRALDWSAVAVTGRLQAGSLPVYLAVILVMLLAEPGSALITASSWPHELPLWDYRIQLPLAACVVLASLAVVRADGRLTATLLLGTAGYGIGALYVVDGAPDLALAQFLVETLSLIAFVFVLRRMPVRFSTADRSAPLWLGRVAIAGAVGVFVAGFAIVTSGSRATPEVVSTQFIARSPAETGATNVVNAIIVDFRAFDTLGEISVLAVATLGVASLLLFARTPPPREATAPRGTTGGGAAPGPGRSVLLEVTTRAVFPVLLVFSLYLLFAGHTRTGGGFSGGLVAGLAFVLRYVSGRRHRVGAAVPVVPTTVMGAGLVVAGVAALAPTLVGDPVLESYVFHGELPVLGDVELVTSVFFDCGVYLLIVGVVLELLRTLGTAVDKEADAGLRAADDPSIGVSP